ncbi:hypothetical protein J7T55_015032 [Diaporthe amygdali]|uniref:uncharacterized protein n=1 Tax=Phomopsis amygdali TaxID=1214568 RepID=UPI0022FE422D|nr:uncharacterized protein J7T55_015032 [Diaporthe amygdali]KAJ0108598.1 hypothetical protein J7T55_015032 [Diaporthe amygdali]
MASCSRGYGLGRDILLLLPRSAGSANCFQPCATRIYQARRTIRSIRTFETSAHLHAKQKHAPSGNKQKPAPKKPPPPTLPYQPTKGTPAAAAAATAKQNAVALSVAERLAQRGAPTVLYEGPSHFWLRASGLSASVFCMGYVGVHYWSIMVHPPEGLPWWVPHAFVPILMLMGYFGGHFALGAANIVSSIRAVPRDSLPRSYLTGGTAKSRSKAEERSLVALNASPVALEVALSQMLPLLPPKKIVVAPEEVALPFKMQSTPVGRGETAAARASGRSGGVMDKIAAPFEALGRAVKGPFSGIVRGLTREGFAKIQVKGDKYKIDVLGGKVLEEGKILDHLVAYRPDRVSSGFKLW